MASTVDERLLDVIACPADDHGALDARDDDDTTVLVCRECGRRYPVQDGIPVLLISEALDAS